jgi:hypothetical protein
VATLIDFRSALSPVVNIAKDSRISRIANNVAQARCFVLAPIWFALSRVWFTARWQYTLTCILKFVSELPYVSN